MIFKVVATADIMYFDRQETNRDVLLYDLNVRNTDRLQQCIYKGVDFFICCFNTCEESDAGSRNFVFTITQIRSRCYTYSF